MVPQGAAGAVQGDHADVIVQHITTELGQDALKDPSLVKLFALSVLRLSVQNPMVLLNNPLGLSVVTDTYLALCTLDAVHSMLVWCVVLLGELQLSVPV